MKYTKFNEDINIVHIKKNFLIKKKKEMKYL